MRKIKFRAWDKKEKRMFSMDDIKGSLGLYFNYTNRSYEEGDKFVDRFIQMQYTGLKDRNGKEIYEGDIFHIDDKEVEGIVIYKNGGFKGAPLEPGSCINLPQEEDRIKIIGNIFENEIEFKYVEAPAVHEVYVTGSIKL
ncbi:DNA-packaging protein [Clostridium niameyense]|uniref:DNA-packaging protein n=1 Tax=Clostridium niameyense TaxID=1622073 RepID=A0A6M0RDC9_9CLOT|nr:YopX family protein [Clostridium niameyense]NEZ47810.1 DNA-packaging protein [Clostridium niameyense]